MIEESTADWVGNGGTRMDSIGEKLLWLKEYHNSAMLGLSGDDWAWLLSGGECNLDKNDFFVAPTKHPLFDTHRPDY